MAGTRIEGSFKSYANIEYKIFIYDAEFVASASVGNVFGDPSTGNVWGDPTTGNVWGWDTLDSGEATGIYTQYIGVGGFHLEYETENENLYTPLMPSRLTFKLIFENAEQEAFLTAMADSYEGQFLVRVLKSNVLFWVGVLMPDVVSWEDAYYPFEFTFTAVDGLSRLKSIEYPNGSFINGSKETILDIIFACLGQLETNGFYAAGDDYFATNNNWWEVRHMAGFSNDPFDLTRFNSSALYEKDSTTGELKFFDCYEMLKQICTVWGARLFQANGKWWLQQVYPYMNSVQIQRLYTKAAVQTYATGGQSYDLTVNQSTLARSKGRYEFLPPLKKVRITYKHRGISTSLINGITWNYTTAVVLTNIGTIGNNGGVAKLKFSCNLEHVWRYADKTDPDSKMGGYHTFQIQLIVGSYYLVGDDTEAEWTLTPGYYAYTTPFAKQYWNYVSLIEFITPEIPAEGAGQISFEYVETEIPDVPVTTPLPLNSGYPGIEYWVQANPTLIILSNGNETEEFDFLRYEADNPNTNNSKIVDLVVYFGDGPYPASASRLETSNGSTWSYSTLWGGMAAVSRTNQILELLAEKIMQAQLTPRIKYVGNLISTTNAPYFPYSRLKIGLKYYLFLGGTFEADQDTWTNLHIFNIKDEPTEVEAIEEPVPVGP